MANSWGLNRGLPWGTTLGSPLEFSGSVGGRPHRSDVHGLHGTQRMAKPMVPQIGFVCMLHGYHMRQYRSISWVRALLYFTFIAPPTSRPSHHLDRSQDPWRQCGRSRARRSKRVTERPAVRRLDGAMLHLDAGDELIRLRQPRGAARRGEGGRLKGAFGLHSSERRPPEAGSSEQWSAKNRGRSPSTSIDCSSGKCEPKCRDSLDPHTEANIFRRMCSNSPSFSRSRKRQAASPSKQTPPTAKLFLSLAQNTTLPRSARSAVSGGPATSGSTVPRGSLRYRRLLDRLHVLQDPFPAHIHPQPNSRARTARRISPRC